MGPRSHERGNMAPVRARVAAAWIASMGPRSHERGNLFGDESATPGTLALQWGRVLMNAETWAFKLEQPVSTYASMGPRSHERGNSVEDNRVGLRVSSFNGAAFS